MKEFVEDVIGALKRRHDELAAEVLDGKCENFAEYRQMTGRLEGLREASDLLRAEWERFQKGTDDEDDDDGQPRPDQS